jgi:hypothetical protein
MALHITSLGEYQNSKFEFFYTEYAILALSQRQKLVSGNITYWGLSAYDFWALILKFYLDKFPVNFFLFIYNYC